MKWIFSLIWIGLLASNIFSQALKTIPLENVQNIEVDLAWANVTIENGTQNEIQIEGTINVNEGENNDAHKISVEKNGDHIKIYSFIEDLDKLPDWVKVHSNGKEYSFKQEGDQRLDRADIMKKLGLNEIDWINFGPIIEIQLVVKVPVGKQISIKSKYGNVFLNRINNGISVENTYGHVLAEFDQPLKKDCSIASTYSYVDVSIRENTRLDLTLHTQFGEIFTDLDVNIDQESSLDKQFNSLIVGSLNEGGKDLHLKATYNNVYLRKW